MRYSSVFQDLTENIGVSAARKLVEEYGGRCVYILRRKNVTEEHRLSILIGFDKAQVLCDMYGGSHIALPLAHTSHAELAKEKAIKMLREGEANGADIALACGVNLRTVRKYKALMRKERNQRLRQLAGQER